LEANIFIQEIPTDEVVDFTNSTAPVESGAQEELTVRRKYGLIKVQNTVTTFRSQWRIKE